MATLVVVVTGCEVKKGKGNYFVMCQLDQASNNEAKMEADKISMKKKTDISQGSQYPNFSVNTLLFEDVVIFSDLSLKLGLFEIVKGETTPVLLGTNKMQITPKMVADLSKGQLLKEAFKMISMEPKKKEVGVVGLVIKLKATYAEQKAYQEIQKIKEIYYDPFEKRPDIIKKKLPMVIAECKKHQGQIYKYQQKLDGWNRAIRDLAQDLELLRRTKESLEAANDEMAKRLENMQSVDEIHIEFDVLSTTEEGINQLKEKMAKIMARIQLEDRRYKELQAEYFALKKYIEVAHKIKKDLEEAKQAGEVEQLHYERALDLVYVARMAKQTVVCQEAIIANLSKASKYVLSESPNNGKEIEVVLDQLRHDRQRLEEKRKQLAILNELYDNKAPTEMVEKLLNGLEEADNETPIGLEALKERHDALTKEVQSLNAELNSETIKDGMMTLSPRNNKEEWEEEKKMLLYKIKLTEEKARIGEKTMLEAAEEKAKVIAELKHKIAVADSLIENRSIIE